MPFLEHVQKRKREIQIWYQIFGVQKPTLNRMAKIV